jgi:hypothetical protein
MDQREQFIKDFVQAGKSKGATKEQVSQKLESALKEYDSQYSQTQPTQPAQQKGLGQKALDVGWRALNFPSAIIGGGIQAGNEYAEGTYQPPKTGINIPGTQKDLGTLVNPALVGAVRGAKSNTSVMEELPKSFGADPNSVPGMALGFAGELATPDPLDIISFGKLAGKATNKAGEVIKKSGADDMVRGLKATDKQISNFAKQTGEDLTSFMGRHNLVGDLVNKGKEVAQKLQEQFDEIAIKSDRLVDSNTLYSSFQKRFGEMSESILPEVKSKSNQIKQAYSNLVKQFGDEIGVEDLTNIRKQVDKQIKDGSFNMPVEQATYLRSVRDALQESIQIATKDIKIGGQSLKELGKELQKFYKFEELAEAGATKGKGRMGFGLTDTVAALPGLVSGNIPAIIAGVLGKRFLNSDTFTAGKSIAKQKAGKALQESKIVPKGMEALMRAAKEMGLSLGR